MDESSDSPASQTPGLRWIWATSFLYTAVAAAVVQFVLLPHVFTSWHAGHGLLAGGDWVGFHDMAAGLADRIEVDGWGAWEFRPRNQGLVGVMAAFYALIAHEPWTLIPLNAALNATAVMLLVLIVQVFTASRRLAVAACLPFLLYPSALLWNAQIHNDSFFIAGALLFLHGWILLGRRDAWDCPCRPAGAWGCAVLGAFLVWVVRPYGVQMMQGVGVFMALFLSGLFVRRAVKSGGPGWRRAAAGALVAWGILFSLSPLARHTLEKAIGPLPPPYEWAFSSWLPRSVDAQLRELAIGRNGSVSSYPDAASNMDTNVVFHCAVDVMAYTPRAAQIGLLAPFPNAWARPGASGATTWMRRISALEMTGVYLALAALPLALWRWRDREAVWLAGLFCFGMLMLYSLVVANVGSLYRVRYAFLMTLVAMGLAGILDALRRRRAAVNRSR